VRKIAALIVALVIITLAIVLVVFRADQNPVVDPTKLQVTTSFYPLAFFAEQIGGDKVQVTNLTPAGAEPHEYELTPQQITTLQASRLLLINGAGLEPWAQNVATTLDPAKTTLVTVGQDLATKKGDAQAVDPHVWLSPVLAQKMADTIEIALTQADPANASTYHANASGLQNQLAQLDAAYLEGLNTCKRRDIITTHVAFAYLADTYNLKQVAITGVSPEAEPSAQELANLAEFAKKNAIKFIFVEKLASTKFAETLANEVGAKTLVLDPLEGLSDDDGAAGKNYFSQMTANLTNLKTALECQR
jgi:zinc transport system substrate-binding protein